jgi:hypothetical protein
MEMRKTVKRYEVQTVVCYTHYYFNKESNCFDDEGCYSCNESRYTWETKEEMLRDFFAGFNANEFKNSLDANIRLCEITETWTREDIKDDWEFENEETTVLIEFKIYDWLKNNGMIKETV